MLPKPRAQGSRTGYVGRMQLFEAGSVIERREVLHGRLWLSTPVTVVSDDGDILAVRLDPGAPITFAAHPFGRHPWAGSTRWAETIVLQLYRPRHPYLHHQRAQGRIEARTVLAVLEAAAQVEQHLIDGTRWWSDWDSWTPSGHDPNPGPAPVGEVPRITR